MNAQPSPTKIDVPAMTYVEFCRAYWKNGYHYPYPVPNHDDPSPSPAYCEFVAVRHSLGRDDDPFDRGLNLLRACYEYLAGSEGKLVSLSQMLTFLQHPPQEILTTLAGYQPVYVWLLRGHQLLEGTVTDDVFCLSRVEGATEAARYYVQECLNFSKIQENRQQALAQDAELQRKQHEYKAGYEHAQQMVGRYELAIRVLVKILIFGLGLAVGYSVAPN